MPRIRLTLRYLVMAAAALLLMPSTGRSQAAPLFFRDVRVFDGSRVLESQNVLVRDGKIVSVGRNVAAPANADVVDGAGKTLLPGLIDAHTHTWGDALQTSIVFGVTTQIDMFTSADFMKQMADEQAAGKAQNRADLVSAGILVTAPGGHGTEYGMKIPTIASPESAQAFVDARLAEGSQFIKIVYDDGKAYGMSTPTVNKETMRAVVSAAHKRGRLAVVHIGSLQGAREAIDVGADGLVHTFIDRDPDPEFGRFVAAHRAFVIPTLTVNLSVTGTAGGATLVSDAHVAPYLTKLDMTVLQQSFPPRPGSPIRSYAAAEASVRQLKAAGVPILAGTDAGNPGTSHGAALHRELELLVNAGLTPVEALAAATSLPAKHFRLADRGRIAAGERADLLLVSGNPTIDITKTRDIAGIWKAGARVDRAAYAKRAEASRMANAAPPGSESGLVSDFEGGDTKAAFGSGWLETLDQMAGGKSIGSFKVVDGGASGSAKSLEISGTIDGALPYAWGGTMFSPGERPMSAANLSSKKEIAFWAKGDGKTYRVMVFSESRGFTPLIQTFVAGPEWTEVVLPISSFGGIDGKDLLGVAWVGGPQPGSFAFRIDNVRFR